MNFILFKIFSVIWKNVGINWEYNYLLNTLDIYISKPRDQHCGIKFTKCTNFLSYTWARDIDRHHSERERKRANTCKSIFTMEMGWREIRARHFRELTSFSFSLRSGVALWDPHGGWFCWCVQTRIFARTHTSRISSRFVSRCPSIRRRKRRENMRTLISRLLLGASVRAKAPSAYDPSKFRQYITEEKGDREMGSVFTLYMRVRETLWENKWETLPVSLAVGLSLSLCTVSVSSSARKHTHPASLLFRSMYTHTELAEHKWRSESTMETAIQTWPKNGEQKNLG